jgi:hypothetical protein
MFILLIGFLLSLFYDVIEFLFWLAPQIGFHTLRQFSRISKVKSVSKAAPNDEN